MNKTDDMTADNDTGEIEISEAEEEKILRDWIEGKTVVTTAEELRLPLGVVSRNLKQAQKAKIEEWGESLEEENNF